MPSKRYCEMCDKWVASKQVGCKSCGGHVEGHEVKVTPEMVVDAAVEYEYARREAYRLLKERESHQCEYYEPAEPDVGAPEVPPCRHAGAETSEWCEPCKLRDAIHPKYADSVRVARLKLKKLQRRAHRVILQEGSPDA